MMNGQRAPVVKDRHTMQENIYATLRGQICWLERAPGSIMSASEIAASMTILMEIAPHKCTFLANLHFKISHCLSPYWYVILTCQLF